MMKSAFLMVVYALAMIAMGVLAYLVALEGGKAVTALIIPAVCGGLMLVCAGLSTMGALSQARGKGAGKAGMIGIHLGLILPLVFAAAFVMRALPATAAFLDAKAQLLKGTAAENLAAAVLDRTASDGEAAAALGKDYLIVSLWALAFVSVLAFFAIVSHRPKMVVSAKPADKA